MECPHCHSDDIARSRRRFLDRLILPLLHGEVLRCRDCRTRFWVGVQWSKVILGCLTATVTAVVIVAMVAVHQSNEEKLAAAAQAARFRKVVRRTRPAFPRGLPPLSSVPAPKPDSPETTAAAKR